MQKANMAWSNVVASLRRPYKVTLPMVVLVSLVPFYIFIAEMMPGRSLHVPAVHLDHLLPLQPAWAIIYGTLYVFLIVLPVLIVRQENHIRNTVRAYLFIWLTAYVCFWIYPTQAPRPLIVTGASFAHWGLRFLYSADPPYNCFPSLHVAHSFVSACACLRVNRKVGVLGLICAALVGVSTLFTKQHYVLDVISGMLLAGFAYVLFIRKSSPLAVPENEREIAPALVIVVLGIIGLVMFCFWIAYLIGGVR